MVTTLQPHPCFYYSNPCNENRVPCNENRFFLVRKTSEGNPCFHYRDAVCKCNIAALFLFQKFLQVKSSSNVQPTKSKVLLKKQKKLSLYKSNNTNILEKNFFTKSSVRIQKLKCDTRIAIFHIVQSQLYSEMFF